MRGNPCREEAVSTRELCGQFQEMFAEGRLIEAKGVELSEMAVDRCL